MTIRVAIADDHKLLLGALEAMLAPEPDIEVVGTANDGIALLELVARKKPDVVVADIGMPRMNGLEAVQRMLALNRTARVIVLSGFTDKRFVLEALNAGAAGYVAKMSAADQLPRAIRSVAQGGTYLCPESAGAVVESIREKGRRGSASAPQSLAPRERDVVRLLAEGKTSPEIAEELGITANTVDTHRRNILRKLGLHSVAEVVRYAIRNGLVTP
ncbi:MAG: response regulator transcription factor [Proteobacteria bacterium]|nr:response regulator transcription factor [Pseudomonadota bacterium]